MHGCPLVEGSLHDASEDTRFNSELHTARTLYRGFFLLTSGRPEAFDKVLVSVVLMEGYEFNLGSTLTVSGVS